MSLVNLKKGLCVSDNQNEAEKEGVENMNRKQILHDCCGNTPAMTIYTS